MDKEKMEQGKAWLKGAVHWGRKQITPQRLKKGAGCLLVLAVAAGGGKFALHRARAEARSQEAQARTKMLQNLAAQKNLSLASIDAVKENIASTPDIRRNGKKGRTAGPGPRPGNWKAAVRKWPRQLLPASSMECTWPGVKKTA